MSGCDHAHEVLFVEILSADLRTEIVNHPEIQVDRSVTERSEVLLSFGHEPQAHPWSVTLDLADQAGGRDADEGIVGSYRERTIQRCHIDAPAHFDEGVRLFDEFVHPAVNRLSPRSRHQPSARSNQNRVTESQANPSQGPTGRRNREVEPIGRSGHASLLQEDVQSVQEVQIDLRHTQVILSNMSLDSKPDHRRHWTLMATPSIESAYRRRWLVLATLCLSVLMVVMANMALNVALPTLARTLHAGTTSLAWVVDLYVLCFAGLLLPAGSLGDRFGRKGALQCGLVVFVVASAAGALSVSTSQLILARAAMGVGAAFVMPGTLAILATVFPPAERPKAIAIWASVAGGSVAVSILWSGFILEHFWWGSIFIGLATVGTAALIAGYFLLPTSRHPQDARLDLGGAVLSVISVEGLLYGFIQAPQNRWTSPTILAAFALGAVGLVAFAVVEDRTERPMLDLRFFRQRQFALGGLSIAAAYFALFGMYFVFTQYLQLVRGYSSLVAGALALPAGLAQFAVANLSKPLVGRFGFRNVLVGGLLASAAGLLVLATSEMASGPWAFEIGLGLIGAGIGLTMPPATGAIMSSLPPHKAGVGSAVNDLVRELGGAFGIGVLGGIALSRYRSGLGVSRHLVSGTSNAQDGLAQALAGTDGARGGTGDVARAAFSGGLDLAMIVGAGFVFVAALVVGMWNPSRVQPQQVPSVESFRATV
jgi:MFS transporter, DHA2 family, multidrug resistance protein